MATTKEQWMKMRKHPPAFLPEKTREALRMDGVPVAMYKVRYTGTFPGPVEELTLMGRNKGEVKDKFWSTGGRNVDNTILLSVERIEGSEVASEWRPEGAYGP